MRIVIKSVLAVLMVFFVETLNAQTMFDTTTVVQNCIDLEDLQSYYHIDSLSDRNPLAILNNGVLPTDLKLEKFNEPVVFMNKEELFFHGITWHLVFDKLEMSPTIAVVHFSYPIEGIEIMATFEKRNTSWVLRKHAIIEK